MVGLRSHDRYVLREVISPFLFGVAAFTGLFVASQVVFSVATLIAQSDASAVDVGLYFVYELPSIISLTFPMAMLFGALFGFSRLSSHSELVAFRASGIGLIRLVVPVIVMACVVSLASLFVGESLVPAAAYQKFLLEKRILHTQETWIKGDDISLVDRNAAGIRLTYIGSLRDNTITNVVVVEMTSDGVTRITKAERGVWERDEGSWYYENGTVDQLTDDGRVRMEFKQNYQKLPLEEPPDRISVVNPSQSTSEMSYSELKYRIASKMRQGADASEIRKELVDLYSKIAIPFSSLVFALIGIPLGIQPNRSGSSIGFGLSILIILVYYVIMTVARALGEGGSIPPLAAAWLQNILIGGVGVFLLVKADQ